MTDTTKVGQENTYYYLNRKTRINMQLQLAQKKKKKTSQEDKI